MNVQGKRRRQIRSSTKSDANLKLVTTGQTRKPLRGGAELPHAAPDPSFIRDSYSSTALAEIIDRSVHAATARFTAGLSPMMLISAYLDWAAHLGFSPGKRFQLAEKAIKKSIRLGRYVSHRATGVDSLEPCIRPLPQERRFLGHAWQRPPYDTIYQSFLLTQQWWHNAVTGVSGVTRQHENTVAFATRPILDLYSPSNFPLTNPEVLERTRREGGMNLVRGLQNFLEDWERAVGGHKPTEAHRFKVGRNVAVTPGKVIYRNRLIELICVQQSDRSLCLADRIRRQRRVRIHDGGQEDARALRSLGGAGLSEAAVDATSQAEAGSAPRRAAWRSFRAAKGARISAMGSNHW